jgi:hypothetical protein
MKTNRERLNAILHYQDYDRMPIMHFGFWQETLEKWVKEGYLAPEEIAPILNRGNNSMDGSEAELKIAQKLGFDDNFLVFTGQKGGWANAPLWPVFEEKVVRQLDGDHFVKIDRDGVYIKTRKGAVSIAEEIDHSAKDRETWEKNYVPRLAWNDERLDTEKISALILTRYYCDRMKEAF